MMAGDGGGAEKMRATAAPFLPSAGDARFDGVVPARLEQAMAGSAILGPERADALAPPRGIGFVPDLDISLRQRRYVHDACPFRRSRPFARERCAGRGRRSMTSKVKKRRCWRLPLDLRGH